MTSISSAAPDAKTVAKPLVSICCITYNHAPYIAEAIRGFLSQRTDFSVEILIQDDASSDQTQSIIQSFCEQYPGRITAYLLHENVFSQGVCPFELLRTKASGKYLALCEGDDYWTDPKKLQRQVELLETRLDLSGCCHTVSVLDERVDPAILSLLHRPQAGTDLHLDDLLAGNPISTPTILLRASALPMRGPAFDGLKMWDWPMWILALRHGPIHFLDANMAVYRAHQAGTWTSRNHSDRAIAIIDMLSRLYDFLERSKHLKLTETILRQYAIVLLHSYITGCAEKVVQALGLVDRSNSHLSQAELDSLKKTTLRAYFQNPYIPDMLADNFFCVQGSFGSIDHAMKSMTDILGCKSKARELMAGGILKLSSQFRASNLAFRSRKLWRKAFSASPYLALKDLITTPK